MRNLDENTMRNNSEVQSNSILTTLGLQLTAHFLLLPKVCLFCQREEKNKRTTDKAILRREGSAMDVFVFFY